MKWKILIGIALVAASGTAILAIWPAIKRARLEQEKMANLPEPPAGYRWESIPELSDE